MTAKSSKMTETPSRRPPVPWLIKIASAAENVVGDAARRRDGTVNRRILNFLDFRAPPNPTPVDGVATSDHTVDVNRDLKVRLFSPSIAGDDQKRTSPLSVVVYFHGGGFYAYSAFSRPFDSFCRQLSRQIPAYIVSVDYRLSPEHRYPAAYDDGFDVLRWLDSGNLIADLSAVFIAGDSAGGNIAHHVARRATTSSFQKLSVVGVVAFQPFFGGEEDTESEKMLDGVPFGSRERFKWTWRTFLPVGSSLDHEAANVFGPGSGSGSDEEDWGGFPPTMVIIGGLDTLKDRQRWYVEGLKRMGVDAELVEYPNATHAFQFFPNLPEARQVIGDVADFMRRRSDHHHTARQSEEVNIYNK